MSLSQSDTELLRNRLRDLNTKSYYLLVALSFIYGTSTGSYWLKSALALTALAAVPPVQDYVTSMRGLERIRKFKIGFLYAALFCTLWWIASATPARTLSQQPSKTVTVNHEPQTDSALRPCPENDPVGLLSKESCKPISPSKNAPPCPPTDPLGLNSSQPCTPLPEQKR